MIIVGNCENRRTARMDDSSLSRGETLPQVCILTSSSSFGCSLIRPTGTMWNLKTSQKDLLWTYIYLRPATLWAEISAVCVVTSVLLWSMLREHSTTPLMRAASTSSRRSTSIWREVNIKPRERRGITLDELPVIGNELLPVDCADDTWDTRNIPSYSEASHR